MPWKTSGNSPRITASLAKRARRRLDDVERLGPGRFRVHGNDELGDAYSHYDITNGHCSCQDHKGGQYRTVCSHKIAAKLWRGRNRTSTKTEPEPEPEPEPKTQARVEQATPRSPSSGLLHPPSHPSWGLPSLPSWIEAFRPHQEHAVTQIIDAFDQGFRYVFLDAPTGSGKTLIAEAVRRKLNDKALYTSSTKSLQDQFLTDYPYAKVLKGRANYTPIDDKGMGITCDACNWQEDSGCSYCPARNSCPYVVAKTQAKDAPLAVVNNAYALAEWSLGDGSDFTGRDLVIADECDLLENTLMGFLEISISDYRQRRHGITPPDKKTKEEAWLDWVDATIPEVKRQLRNIGDADTPEEVTDAKYLSRLLGRLETLQAGLSNEDEDATRWVYTGYDQDKIVFKPVTVDEYAPSTLWKHANRWLLMSASIISADHMASSLGIPEGEWTVVAVPSTFPPENRPVHLAPIANVTSKTHNQAVDKLADAIDTLLDHHEGERVLIHTHSYRLTRDLNRALRRTRHAKRLVTPYTNSFARDRALTDYKNKEGGVLLAPSLDRGIDLPGELCSVQIIAKVPYPYLGDKQVSARLYGTKGGQAWFNVQTIRSIVQMTGRGVRSADDTATTYILDKQFMKVWKRSKRLFPSWWREAVKDGGQALNLLKGV